MDIKGHIFERVERCLFDFFCKHHHQDLSKNFQTPNKIEKHTPIQLGLETTIQIRENEVSNLKNINGSTQQKIKDSYHLKSFKHQRIKKERKCIGKETKSVLCAR